jgi:hypothetical protein
VSTKAMTPARDMRANSNSASPKACWHQKAGRRKKFREARPQNGRNQRYPESTWKGRRTSGPSLVHSCHASNEGVLFRRRRNALWPVAARDVRTASTAPSTATCQKFEYLIRARGSKNGRTTYLASTPTASVLSSGCQRGSAKRGEQTPDKGGCQTYRLMKESGLIGKN